MEHNELVTLALDAYRGTVQKFSSAEAGKVIVEEIKSILGTDKIDIKSLIIFSIVSAGYLLVFNFLGFIISTIILLVLLMLLLGERRWWFIALVSVISSLVIYVLFAKYLSVMLPKGKIFWYLGI